MPAVEDLLQPISGPNPAGANLRYDPIYDKIKEARREDEDIPQGEWTVPRKIADWPFVLKHSRATLQSKSKDLQLAVWYAEARLHLDSVAGLREGVELLRGMLERFWDNVHPQLEDGDASLRAAPLEWIGRYLAPAVRSTPVNKAGHDLFQYRQARLLGYEADAAHDEKKQTARQEAVAEGKLTLEEFDRAFEATPKAWYRDLFQETDTCLKAILALDAVGQERFGADAPSYGDLIKALEDFSDVVCELLARKLEVDPDPPDIVATTEEGGAVSTAPSSVSSPASQAPEPLSPDDAAARIASAARYLRRADPRNPAPYLLLRGFRWGELRKRVPDLDPRLLTAPPTPVRTQLKGLLLDQKWPELLDAAEDVMAMPYGRGWLDLQRYAISAAERLGGDYGAVARSLRASLAALLHDLPQLSAASLMDDTPTANAETQAWLEETGVMSSGGEAGGAPTAPSAERPRATGHHALARAQEEARAGRPQRGIELLLRQAEQETSARARFLCRSAAAGIMVDAGLESVAQPILKELLDQIEAHQLENWEAGDVVARALGFMYRCLDKLGGDAEAKSMLFRRISRLDPLQAIAFPERGGTDGGG